jgi:hypothetical protein
MAGLVGCTFLLARWAQAQDYTWTFTDDGFSNYILLSVSSPDVYSGIIPANDPTLNLRLGKRYSVTVVNYSIHPLQILAKGATALDDLVLLSQGATVGTFESVPGVNWQDDGLGHVAFTVTESLYVALKWMGRVPGYRCEVHATTMRGNFLIPLPASDYGWTFNNNDNIAYVLTDFSSTTVYAGALPASNPTITLRVGKRYRATILNPLLHPFEVIAKGATDAQDQVLLSQAAAGSLEGDPAINWVDDGIGNAAFTVTLPLVQAMRGSGRVPGYRCAVHTNVIRGDFSILGAPLSSTRRWVLYR